MAQILTLTRTTRQGQPLIPAEVVMAEPVNIEAELEAEMMAYEKVAQRARETIAAMERAIGIADILIALHYTLAGLAGVWLLGRLVTGI
ncbi:hypothetical protein [Rhizobium wuzhouense]|uniref:Uncharacterized protein n=1 Tax=Rhizobium wuzhouense TaxID=1986026 RepID=A0ABX5NRW6_9HYPH|nr:hypothetical protein [Rhizobium wuzhouense]PYB71294.1 hypothetical protein DMY87_18225 [Rhizobium wuzhouense]